MKKILIILAASATFGVLAPATSQAFDGHGSSRSFVNHCSSCGTPVYRERAIVGHDRHGHPIFGYRTISHNCRPSFGRHGHGHSHGPSIQRGFPFNFFGRSNRH